MKSTHIHRVQQAKILSQITPKTEGSVTSGVDSIFTDEESYEIDKLLNDLGLSISIQYFPNFIFDFIILFIIY